MVQARNGFFLAANAFESGCPKKALLLQYDDELLRTASRRGGRRPRSIRARNEWSFHLRYSGVGQGVRRWMAASSGGTSEDGRQDGWHHGSITALVP